MGLTLGASISSAHPAHRSLQEDGSEAAAPPATVATDQIEQIKKIMVDFTLGEEHGHFKDPDYLDGDNPGWLVLHICVLR